MLYGGENNKMNELLSKLSSYNIFNYLLPGVLFAVIGDEIASYSLMQKEIIVGAFIYYFYGLVISRIGSLILEPIVKWLGFVNFSLHEDFVSASQVDGKIEILLEESNMYRTLSSLFFCLLLVKSFDVVSGFLGITIDNNLIVLIALFAVLFLVSYRKQSDYITRRIRKIVSTEGDNASKNTEGE